MLSLLLSLILVMPLPLFAQEQDNIPAATEMVPPTVLASPTSESESGEGISEPVVQETIAGELLEAASNPQEGSALEEAIEVIDEGTEDRIESETLVAATSTEPALEITQEADEVIEVLAPETEEVAALEEELLVPSKEFTFEIRGETIAAKEETEWSEHGEDGPADSALITDVPALSTIQETLSISGTCDDLYYVILIYRNADDYDKNPSSYIYNRAYPCGNGHFNYDLNELPFNLESGTFYLLVGGQGGKGGWKPISALTPIGITVKEVLIPTQEENPNETTP